MFVSLLLYLFCRVVAVVAILILVNEVVVFVCLFVCLFFFDVAVVLLVVTVVVVVVVDVVDIVVVVVVLINAFDVFRVRIQSKLKIGVRGAFFPVWLFHPELACGSGPYWRIVIVLPPLLRISRISCTTSD